MEFGMRRSLYARSGRDRRRAFVKTSIDAPIATITGVPATWAGK